MSLGTILVILLLLVLLGGIPIGAYNGPGIYLGGGLGLVLLILIILIVLGRV